MQDDGGPKTARSFHLPRQLLDRVRAAAHWIGQHRADLPDGLAAGEPSNVSELVEQALRREVARLEALYNAGQPFPAVRGRMRTGPGAAGAARISAAQRARWSS